MNIKETIRAQLRSVIQWEKQQEFQLFYKFTDKGDEIKNASKWVTEIYYPDKPKAATPKPVVNTPKEATVASPKIEQEIPSEF